MQRIIHSALGALLLCLSLPAQTLVFPHVVDGQGWQSTIVLTNTTATPASATLVFHKETTGGNTAAWTPPFIEVVSTAGLSLTGGSTMFLHTVGTAADLSQGWAELNADPGVIGYLEPGIRASERWHRAGSAIVGPDPGSLRRLFRIVHRHRDFQPHRGGSERYRWLPDYDRRSRPGCALHCTGVRAHVICPVAEVHSDRWTRRPGRILQRDG